MKHKNTQPLYIFNRENPQNSEPQNGPRSGLDYIALDLIDDNIIAHNFVISDQSKKGHFQRPYKYPRVRILSKIVKTFTPHSPKDEK